MTARPRHESLESMGITDLNVTFHIGLHKTGTTFLQRAVFPRLTGVEVLRYRNLEYLTRLSPERAYLVSCEGLSGTTFAPVAARCAAIGRLGQLFPQARVIVGFRRHGSYLASLYSQYLRYGGKGGFEQFFSLSGAPEALLRREDVGFARVLAAVQAAFQPAPLVMTSDDLGAGLDATLRDLADYLGTTAPATAEIAAGTANQGLTRPAGELLRRLNAASGCRFTPDGRNRPYPRLRRLRLDPPEICLARLRWLGSAPLVDPEIRNTIDTIFADDWQAVLAARDATCRHRALAESASSGALRVHQPAAQRHGADRIDLPASPA